MLTQETKRKIDSARDILVGKIPDPKAQVEQITTALIYKFMDDMDKESMSLPKGKAQFFANGYQKYAWNKLMDPKLGGHERLNTYVEAITRMSQNPHLPQLFRDIFKDAYLPYRDPETLNLFLKEINGFNYDHSEDLGDAYEYLLAVLGSQGDAGQFRTPRHIIDFIVEVVDPKKDETILDPACGTAGFLISAYKHILKANKEKPLTPDEKKRLMSNFTGYDISPDMVKLSLVNMYLHGFPIPHIHEYDTLTSEEKWDDRFDVIMANPPFMTPRGGIRPHKRFSVQANRSEVLFVDYIMEHLNNKGRAGMIVPEGVIFQSGTAYKQLRKLLIDDGLYAVVSLPAGVFNPYSGVKTSILFFDNQLAKQSKEILFVKVLNDGFGLGAQRRAIDRNDLNHAVEVLRAQQEALKTGHKNGLLETRSLFAWATSKEKIAESGDYNLSGDRYNHSKALLNHKWDIVELGKLLKTASGGTPLSSHRAFYENGTIPWINSGEVAQGYIYKAEKFITESGLKSSSAKIFPKDTVLVAMYGATAGQVGILKVEAATNQAVCGIYPSEKFVAEFLYFILKHQKDYLLSLGTGGAQPNISQQVIRELKIPLPPLEFQQQIVAELDGYQKIIDGASQIIANYKPIIKIDASWGRSKLGEICDPEYGYTESAKTTGSARFIRITDIGQNGKLKTDDPKYIDLNEESKPYQLKKGDVLMARTGATYGKTMIFGEEYPAVFASFLIRLNFEKDKILPEYYWVFAQTEDYWRQAKSLVTGGGQPQFNGNAIKEIVIPVPPLKEQERIIAQITKEQEMIDVNTKFIEVFEQKIKSKIAEVWGE